jgi:membrane protein
MWNMIRKTASVFGKAFKKWLSRDPFRESSIIAYNAIFSLPGLLVVTITVSSYFFGTELINKHLNQSIAGAMGQDTADQIQEMIIAAMQNKDSTWAAVLGFITILLGATGVFVQLQKSLNIIWEVKATTKKSGIWTFIKTRLFSFGLIISISFLLLISLVISTILAAVSGWMKYHWSESMLWLFNGLNFLVSLFVITMLFAMIYKILPDAKISWRVVWRGAFVTAILFVIGKTLLGFYFGTASPGSGYGAAGSIVLIMLWTSYSAMIVFFGAEFTKVYSDQHVGNVPANEIASKEKGRQI